MADLSTLGSIIKAAYSLEVAAYTDAKNAKLEDINAGATLNASDAALRDRSSHTGTQLAATISDIVATARAQIEASLVAGTNTTITASGAGATRQLSIASAGASGVADGDKGDVTVTVGGTVWTIDAGAVTLPKLANIATASILGRTTALAGTPEVLTSAQATTLIDTATTSLKGLVPPSGGGTDKFLRSDLTWAGTKVPITIALGDQTTAITAGNSKDSFRLLFAGTLIDIQAEVITAPTGAGNLIVDVNKNGITVLSTKLIFDATKDNTFASVTQRVISAPVFAKNDKISFDVDAISGTLAGAGLKVTMIFEVIG